MKKIILAVLFYSVTSTAAAENNWYFGEVSSVILDDPSGGFAIALENEDVRTLCKDDLIYARSSNLGEERLKAALSMALTSYSMESKFGASMNLENVRGGRCFIGGDGVVIKR